MKLFTAKDHETGERMLLVHEPHVGPDGRPTDGYAAPVDDWYLARGLPGRVIWKLVLLTVGALWALASACVLLGSVFSDVFVVGGTLRVVGYALFWWGVQHALVAPIPDRVPSWAQYVLSWGATVALFFLTHGLVPR